MDPQPLVSPTGPLWREMLESQWCIHSFISLSVPVKEPSNEMGGKHTVTVHGAHVAYIQGIVCNAAVTTPVPCSLQHDTFHFGLRRPELRKTACVNRVSCPHLLAPPMWARVHIHITLRYGQGVGFMGD